MAQNFSTRSSGGRQPPRCGPGWPGCRNIRHAATPRSAVTTDFPELAFDPAPIWLERPGDGDTPSATPRYRSFRRTLQPLSQPAELRLFAEGRYHAWLDDAYLGRGPTYHHPFELLYDTYDLTGRLAGPPGGPHVLAVLVYDPAVATLAHVPTGRPGLWAQVVAEADGGPHDVLAHDGGAWRVTDRTGFDPDVPRRTLVLDHVEHWHPADAPARWREPGFNDGDWPEARPVTPPNYLRPARVNPLPRLRHHEVLASRMPQMFGLDYPVEPLRSAPDPWNPEGLKGTEAYGEALMNAGWNNHPGAAVEDVEPGRSTACRVTGLTPKQGLALVFDLGAEHVGEPLLSLASHGPGTVDLGFAELLDGRGRPRLLMKHGSYANRITTAGGPFDYRAIRYSGFRYLAVMLRGFTGSVRLERVGVHASEPDLTWQPQPTGDDTLDTLFDLSVRTLRLGAQEALLDCPTREQGAYIGDGHPTARWLYTLTGDASYWKRLVRAQFARPARNGPIRSTVFSCGTQMLLDYNLIAVLGTRDYHAHTHDLDTVRQVLPAARGVYAWFERQMDADGWCLVDDEALPRRTGREAVYDPSAPSGDEMLWLFIDHAGLGWHNLGEPGIDRRGVNTALQALLTMTEEALADLEDLAGDADRAATLRAQAARRRSLFIDRFLDPARGVFVDGELNGRRLEQVSQQTNVWAVLAGCCDREMGRAILESLFETPPPGIARCGPYFWVYAVRALVGVGLTGLMLREVKRLWQPMLDAGATSMWETFAGDDLDSRCHPWSGTPIDAVLHGVLGRPFVPRSYGPVDPPRPARPTPSSRATSAP